MSANEQPAQSQPEVAFYNDPVVRGRFYQILVGGGVVLLIWWLVQNTITNLEAQNNKLRWEFLWETSGFDISFSLFHFDRASTYFDAFLVGLTNTLLVAVIGIVLATLLGFSMGVARLSSNWLIARFATVYIEVIRNVPLLLQLFFWYFAVLKAMPAVRQSLNFNDTFFINQRGFFAPRPIPDEQFTWVIVAFLIAVVAVWLLSRWAKKRLETTGERFPTLWASLGILIVFPAIVWLFSGATVSFDYPELQRFNFKGGIELPPEFVALVLGLTIYTGAFIAETVRSGILAVNKGQTEAAQALGLKDGDRLNLVIIPQAMRVIIPPLTSQYLNLTKNSSLGAAIGFPELVNVFAGTTLNQSGQAIPVIAMTMVVYLTLSLFTSLIMNWYNARVALVER